MAIINDPNQTTLEGLIRKVDTVDPQHPGYISNPDTISQGGTNIFGQPTAPFGIQDVFNLISGAAGGGIGSIAKKGVGFMDDIVRQVGKYKSKYRGAPHPYQQKAVKPPLEAGQFKVDPGISAEGLYRDLLSGGLDSYSFQAKLRLLESIAPDLARQVAKELF